MSTPVCIAYPATEAYEAIFPVVPRLMEIDRAVYPGMEEADLGQGRVEALHLARPDACALALSASNEITGYICLLPVTRDARDMICAGLLRDGEIGTGHLVPRGAPIGTLYLMTIGVAPGHQGQGIGRALWDRAMKYWRWQSPREILATVWTRDGSTFLNPLSLGRVGCDQHGHDVIALRATPYPCGVLAA